MLPLVLPPTMVLLPTPKSPTDSMSPLVLYASRNAALPKPTFYILSPRLAADNFLRILYL
ncbi:hypothetical protein MUA02_00035, partial [Enterobacteriaceae bacterium H20N1]